MSNGKKTKKESRYIDPPKSDSTKKILSNDAGFYKKIPPMSKQEEAYYQNFFKGSKDKGLDWQKGTPVKGKPGLVNL